jgi:putative nucleotidyltransferase with HDIG domain
MSSTIPTHIPSGTFRISRIKRIIFEANLGTCVGVAVVDKAAGVGGLYHILLPEQTPVEIPLVDTIYASSGLPVFLRALRAAGCTDAGMEVTLAGGALTGNVSDLDLNLDIGGRTVDVVQRLLKEGAIRVVRSETGGYFGSKLRLNLHTLHCDMEPAYLFKQSQAKQFQSAAPQPVSPPADLDKAIASVEPIPQVALKIIRTVQSDDYSLRDIAREIRQDQVISANVIKLCNSAYVSPKEEIRSIEQALIMLGARLVVQLVLSSALDRFFKQSKRGYSMSKGGLYHHAVSTAIVSEQISRLTGHSEPDIAYTAGLLHDIGKVLLDQYASSALPLFYRRIFAEGEELLDVERSLLGITHEEAGTRLAELWSFPPSLRDAVTFHSRPELAQHDPDLTHVVYLADMLLARFDAGHEMERLGTNDLEKRLRQLDLKPDSLPGIIAQIRWDVLNIPGYF